MKKHWFCFLLTATLLTGMTIGIGAASETANAVPKEVFAAGSYKASNGLTIPYRYYLPESYRTAGKAYPVFIHMHGNGSRGTDNVGQISKTGTELNTAVFRSDYDCIMIAPQCPATDMWIARDAYPGSDKFAADIADGTLERAYLNAAMELLGCFIEDNRNVIDTSRIYLSGASNGAGAAWAMAALHPHTFAAVVPMAGTGQPQGPVTEAGAAAIAAHYLDTPIWTFHGDADPTLLIKGTDALVSAIRDAGGTKIRYTVIEGGKHNIWPTVAKMPEVIDWIFAQKNTQFENTMLPGPSVRYDVNGDGEVNLGDALVMLQSIVGGANKYSLNTVLDVLQYIAAK